MARDWEAQLVAWSVGPGKTEEDRMDRARTAVEGAIRASAKLGEHDIATIVTGSYRNRTHVRGESDVDLCVIYQGMFISDWTFVDPNAKTDTSARQALEKEAGLHEASYPDDEYKADVEAALVARFGRAAVTRGDKAFDIHENTYRVDADVVAAFEHRRWHRNSAGVLVYTKGTQFTSDSGKRIINWPRQQYDNGVAKHERTGRRYKKMVRILKNLRNEMTEAGMAAAEPIPSFLSECLVWNVPDSELRPGLFYPALRAVLVSLYANTKTDATCSEWGEESELKYLFRPVQPWTRAQANAFVLAAWSYVGFS